MRRNLPNQQSKFILLIASLVSVGGVLYGYDVGVISGALLFIKNAIPMTDFQLSVIVGAVLAGGLFGTLLAGLIGDLFGRKSLIASASIIFILAVILVLLSHSFTTMLVARLLLGGAVGMVAVGVPLYVSEMMPPEDRGKYMTFFQLLLTFGIVLAYLVDLAFTASGNWRAMFAVLLIPSTILLLGILILPETPRWLIVKNRKVEALEILVKTRGAGASDEADAIEKSLQQKQGQWRDLLSPRYVWPACLAIAVAIFNQLTGINSFLQYAPVILKSAGMSSNLISMLGSVGIGVLNFIFTLVAILLIDSLGRRPLLLIGTLGVALSEIYLCIVSYFFQHSAYSGWLTLAGLLGFIAFFAVGPGVVVWLAISELFPTQVRGVGISVCLFFSSLSATVLSVCFVPLIKFLGTAETYGLFAIFSLAYCLVTYLFLPETKAKELEEIHDGFKWRKTMSSKKYIGVFCGSSANCAEAYNELARSITRRLIENDFGIVFGGTRAGLMQEVGDAAVKAGGDIIGVVPPEVSSLGIVYPDIKIIETPDYAMRKEQMKSLSYGFVALPGGIGTLDEITEVAIYNMFANFEEGKQSGKVKPLCLLNLNGFYDGFFLQLQKCVAENFLPQRVSNLIYCASSVDEVVDYLLNFEEPAANNHRWWEKSLTIAPVPA